MQKKKNIILVLVDVIGALIDRKESRKYWFDLKIKLSDKGSEAYEKIVRLKLKARDGKYCEIDTLDTKGILILIESVSSPKMAPFKLWLANVGREIIDEVQQIINRKVKVNKNNDIDLFSGYLKCFHCGSCLKYSINKIIINTNSNFLFRMEM